MIRIDNKIDCCGCMACVQKCPKQSITMKVDKEGFWYPKVDLSLCINCGLCESVCPQINCGERIKILKTFAYKHTNKDIQIHSSSGGAFTLLADKIINDGGVVFGAVFDNNWNVVHDVTDNIIGLKRLRMSKYVQSYIGEKFKEAESFLKKGRKVMFVGTPCQIHGLKLFLKKHYENLLCVDFICHGVPSPKVYQEYLRSICLWRGKNSSFSWMYLIKDIQFRNKSFGWKKFSFVLHFNFAEPIGNIQKNIVSSSLKVDNEFRETLYKNPYLRGFSHNLYLRPSCYKCRNKAFRSCSDITLGDFWGIEKTYPELFDFNGVSCIMGNTKHGCNFLDNFEGELSEVDYQKILSHNPSIENSVKHPPFRGLFFKFRGKIPFNTLVLMGLAYNKVFRILKRNNDI